MRTDNNLAMQQFSNLEKVVGCLMLVGAIVFNLWLYRLEPTALVDPNDNHFQYALVDRTNQIWDFADKTCSKNLFFPFCHVSYLIDHWVPNWAQGYNLPYYYSHIPQIVIVASWRAISPILPISLFTYYHVVIYLLLSLFPISVFVALRVLGLSWLTAGIGALLATHIYTDGLYGLDPPTFLRRGYGLTSQLFGMIWLPLAIAYSSRYLTESTKSEILISKQIRSINEIKSKRFRFGILPFDIVSNLDIRISNLFAAVLFLAATTAGHLGIGIIALMSVGLLALGKPIERLLRQQSLNELFESLKGNLVRLMILGAITIFFLSYWVIPLLLHNNFHNISVWDPIWKFNSYGAKETIVRFLNGDLFDFGRFPVFTLLVIIGFFALLLPKNHESRIMNHGENKNSSSDPLFTIHDSLFQFSLLFAFWFLLYFGRTTWGGLIDLIPGMKEFHISRFIVGLHAAGFFLAPIGIGYLASGIKYQVSRIKQLSSIPLLDYWIIGLLVCIVIPPIYRQTIRYSAHNDRLIRLANENAAKVRSDVDLLFTTLRSLPPGRVFAGRGGNWGKNFRVAETPYFMHLSTYGIPTVLWLPETWSPNSDTEQSFSDNRPADYDLYAVRYVVSPPDVAPQPFWKFLKETKIWKLYEVNTKGYITSGTRPAIVATDKESFTNVVRLWIQSDFPKQGLYPELTFSKDYPKNVGLPNFKMIDEATYRVPDGTGHNLFAQPPLYQSPSTNTQSPRVLDRKSVV